MADQLYTSRHRLTYITSDPVSGARHSLVLCDYDSLLTSPVTYGGDVVIQRDNAIASPWILQQSRGNASVTLEVSVASVWPTSLAAEQYGDDMLLWMLAHPVGKLMVEAYPDWDSGVPTRPRVWTAGRDQAVPSPITEDKYFGAVREQVSDVGLYAWLEMSYKFTLSDPVPALATPPSSGLHAVQL